MKTLTDFRKENDAVAEVQRVAALFGSFRREHPEFDSEASADSILQRHGGVRPTAETIEELAIELVRNGIIRPISAEEQQREKQQMADELVAHCSTRKFRPFERDRWNAKVYAMTRERYHHELMRMTRAELKDLVERDTKRPWIVEEKLKRFPAYNPRICLETKAAWEERFAAERQRLLDLRIEELEVIGANLNFVAEHKDATPQELAEEAVRFDSAQHQEHVGSTPLIPPESGRVRDRWEPVTIRQDQRQPAKQEPDAYVSYNRGQLVNMPRPQFRENFQVNRNGRWEYRSEALRESITKVLNGQESELRVAVNI